jgi:hypothetical protein
MLSPGIGGISENQNIQYLNDCQVNGAKRINPGTPDSNLDQYLTGGRILLTTFGPFGTGAQLDSCGLN